MLGIIEVEVAACRGRFYYIFLSLFLFVLICGLPLILLYSFCFRTVLN